MKNKKRDNNKRQQEVHSLKSGYELTTSDKKYSCKLIDLSQKGLLRKIFNMIVTQPTEDYACIVRATNVPIEERLSGSNKYIEPLCHSFRTKDGDKGMVNILAKIENIECDNQRKLFVVNYSYDFIYDSGLYFESLGKRTEYLEISKIPSLKCLEEMAK